MDDKKLEDLKKRLQEESGLYAVYIEDLIAWVLNNCDIEAIEDTPHIFGSGTPAQNIFTQIIAIYYDL